MLFSFKWTYYYIIMSVYTTFVQLITDITVLLTLNHSTYFHSKSFKTVCIVNTYVTNTVGQLLECSLSGSPEFGTLAGSDKDKRQ